MAANVKDLVRAATTAARNQQQAQLATQATAAAIAAQRGVQPRPGTTTAPGGKGETS